MLYDFQIKNNLSLQSKLCIQFIVFTHIFMHSRIIYCCYILLIVLIFTYSKIEYFMERE